MIAAPQPISVEPMLGSRRAELAYSPIAVLMKPLR